jgi:aryl-alcohol dehydrogenase-like predicted oxidoreductase
MMKYRTFDHSDFRSSEIGIGTWQFGGDWGDVTEETALKTLKAGLDKGVNFIDTADVYGAGRSEQIIGKFLSSTSEPVFVATKLGRLRGYPDKYSLDIFKQCTENSLQRLGVEAIDLTQLHCIPTRYLRSGEVFDWLRELQRQGKIRHFGASVETMEEALICAKEEDLSSLQIIFNIFRQKPITALLDLAAEKNVAVIARLPLASGLLADKFDKSTTFPRKDHRNYNRDGALFNVGETFAGLEFEKAIDLVAVLRPAVPEGMTMAQFALRWILDFDAVTVVIPGAKNVAQAESNATASDLPELSGEVHRKLAAFYQTEVKHHIRGPY